MHDSDEELTVGIAEALRTLPLFNNLYLHMQAMNLDIIDRFLVDQEAALLREYMETEKTPLVTAMFVSALSQLWVFGLYELLRTWRQRGRDVLRWHKEFQKTPPNERDTRLDEKKHEIQKRAAEQKWAGFYWPPYEKVVNDPVFDKILKNALDRMERLFYRIEVFRVALAKHKLPGVKDSFAMAPGYGRIDLTSGSIYWQVVLQDNEVDLVSRRTIAEECRRSALNDSAVILAEPLQDKIKKFPNHFYGIKRVTVILADGTKYTGVHVSWAKEVVSVEGYETIPFDADHIIDAQHEPVEEDL